MLPKYLVYITTVLIVLGQFTAIGRGSDAKYYLSDLFVLLSLGISVGYMFVSKQFFLPKNFLLFFVFSFWAGISLLRVTPLFNTSELLVASMYLLRYLSYLVYGVVVFNLLHTKKLPVEDLKQLIIFSGILLAALGFVQLVLLPDFETLDPALGWDPHKNRLASTFFDPNFVGAYLSICIGLIFDKWFSSSTKLKSNWLVPAFGILLLALLLTFSRSSWLMFAVIVFVFGMLKSKTLLLLSVCIAFSAYFAVPRIQTRLAGATDPADSAHFRFISWSNTYEIIKANYMFGVGFNTFRYVQRDYGFLAPGTSGGNSGAGSDSSLMFILATTGVIGLVLFLAGCAYSVQTRDVLLLSVTSGLLVHSVFVNSLFYSPILYLWIMLLALRAAKDHTPLLT